MDDWDQVTKIGSKVRSGGGGGPANDRTGEKKFAIGNAAKGNTEGQRQKKLDDADDVVPLKAIDKAIGKAIMDARNKAEPKLTQEKLATAANVPANDLKKYELGTALPTTKHFDSLERVLKVQLRGKNIGQPRVFMTKKMKEAQAAEEKAAAAAAKKK